MSDMHDTRRLNGGGQDRKLEPQRIEPNVPKAAAPVPAAKSEPSVPVNPQSAWDTEERRKLWRQVTNLGKKVAYNNVRHIVFVTVICGALLFLVWRQQTKFEERIQAERAEREEMAKQVQEFYFALERTAADVDENRKATAAALTPAVTLDPEDFRNRTTRGRCYYGWSIVRMFDDLEVIHLRWNRELYEKYDSTQGIGYDPGEADQFIHLGHALYECAKYQQRESDWVNVRGRLWGFVQAVHGEVVSPKLLHNLDHSAITEYYDVERIIGVLYGGAEKITLYRRLDDATYALAEEMKTLDVWKLKEARRALEKVEQSKEFVREPVIGERVAASACPKPSTLAELRQYDGEKIMAYGPFYKGSCCITVEHLPYAYGERIRVHLCLSYEDYDALWRAPNYAKRMNVQALEDARRNR